jgi:hypothetical protein
MIYSWSGVYWRTPNFLAVFGVLHTFRLFPVAVMVLVSCSPAIFSSWSGVKLSVLGTLITNWPIVPAPDDRRWWICSSRWNENWRGKSKYSEKTCPSTTLSTTNPTWRDPCSNPGRRGRKPMTDRLSYETAVSCSYSYNNFTIAGQNDYLFEAILCWNQWHRRCIGHGKIPEHLEEA